MTFAIAKQAPPHQASPGRVLAAPMTGETLTRRWEPVNSSSPQMRPIPSPPSPPPWHTAKFQNNEPAAQTAYSFPEDISNNNVNDFSCQALVHELFGASLE